MATKRNAGYFQRVAREIVLRDGGVCGICGHAGAITADHIVTYVSWPKDAEGELLPGFDDPSNLRAAHGTRGPAEHNPCMLCDRVKWPRGRMCNQSRGAGREKQPEIHSRAW
jgi:hypothetical protein